MKNLPLLPEQPRSPRKAQPTIGKALAVPLSAAGGIGGRCAGSLRGSRLAAQDGVAMADSVTRSFSTGNF